MGSNEDGREKKTAPAANQIAGILRIPRAHDK